MSIEPQATELVEGFLAAFFCGAFIGVEREFGKTGDAEPGESSARTPAGVRTHILTALLGWLALVADRVIFNNGLILIGGLASVLAIACTGYGLRALRTGHYGITSCVTLVVTYLLGALAQTPLRVTAAGLAVAVTATLAVKAPLHRFVRGLTREEIAAAIKLALVALVMLPWMPDRNLGPLDSERAAKLLRDLGVGDRALEAMAVFNPFGLWALVVAISAIGFGGYVLVRSLGASRGLTLTGLIGGLVSSTAVTLSASQQAKQAPQWAGALSSAALAACSVMALRVMLLIAAFAPGLLGSSAVVLLPMLAVTSAGAVLCARGAAAPGGESGSVVKQTPFALLPALKLAGVFFIIRVAAKALTFLFGGAGLVASAFLSGTVDLDAISVAIAQEFTGAQSAVTPHLAATALFTAVAANTLVKAGLAAFLGGRAMARGAGAWLLASLVAGAAGLAAAFAY